MSLVFNLCRFSSTEEAPVCNVISLRPIGGEQEDAIKFGVLFVRRSPTWQAERSVYSTFGTYRRSQMSDGIYAGREHLSNAVHRLIARCAVASSNTDLAIYQAYTLHRGIRNV